MLHQLPTTHEGRKHENDIRGITSLAAANLSFAGFMHSAQATLVSTEQVAATQGVHSATAQRDQVNTLLARADVAAGLQERGVSVDQARQRVAALTDFSFTPTENGVPVANRVEAGKRPRSAMSPTLVFERASGALLMSLGSPGGSAIINYVGKVLVGTLDWGLNIQQAISLPNFGSRNGPTELEANRASPALIQALTARGHELQLIPQTSGLQGIQRVVKGGYPAWFGGADPRREGVVQGGD